jgi:hypothetical protein
VVQATQPWISTSGIDRGAVWYSAINDELSNTSVGIVCLTHENKNKPWILFEAGALAKGVPGNRVCTFLVDLTPADLESPLSQFNHTTPDRDGMWNLAVTLNNSVATPLDGKILQQVFDTNWYIFENRFTQLLVEFPQNAVPEVRSNDSILVELLESSRGISQRLRKVEEKVVDNIPTPRRPSPAQRGINISAKFAGGGDEIPMEKSFSTGMEIAFQLKKDGIDKLGIHQKLISLGYGNRAIREIFEILEMLGDISDKPDDDSDDFDEKL